PDDPINVTVHLTVTQFKEITRRAGIAVFDGKARSEYIVGCLFGEPSETLLARVAEIRDAERAKFHGEIEAERAEREARAAAQERARARDSDAESPPGAGPQTSGSALAFRTASSLPLPLDRAGRVRPCSGRRRPRPSDRSR